MKTTTKIKSQSGFTIIELMTAVIIGAILAAFAIPSFQEMTKNNCLTTTTNNLITSLQQARSEAIKRKSRVTVSSMSGGNAWGDGWRVRIDEDRNGNCVLDVNEDYDGDGLLDTLSTGCATALALVKESTNTCGATTVTGQDGGGAALTSLFYNGEGFISTAARFDVCDDRTAETGRQININNVGRPTTTPEYNGCL